MAELSIGLIGPGLVGKALLKQVQRQVVLSASGDADACPKTSAWSVRPLVFKFEIVQVAHLEASMGRILRIRGIANSKTMILADPTATKGLNLETWQDQLAKVLFPSHAYNLHVHCS